MTLVILGILGFGGLLWLTTPAGCAFALTQEWLVAFGYFCPIG